MSMFWRDITQGYHEVMNVNALLRMTLRDLDIENDIRHTEKTVYRTYLVFTK